jgi:hypothetical protein
LIGKIFIGISLILAAEPEVQHSPYAVHLCTLGVEQLFYNMRIPFLPVVLLTVCWIGCGGGSSSTTSTTPTPPTPTTPTAPPPPTGTSNAGGNLTTPQVITVANGQATSGINILVPNTASAFNVKLLGVNSLGASTISASNVGGAIARGTSALILIFGSGLTGSQTLSISGPNDISITNQQSVKATDGTPGIEFQISVGSGAAVGARTLSVKEGSNASVFVGGLEVF